MIGKKELAYLECDVCGRVYFFADTDPKSVLSRARESGWNAAGDLKDRFGDTCPKCQPPKDDAHILPDTPPRGRCRRRCRRGVSSTCGRWSAASSWRKCRPD